MSNTQRNWSYVALGAWILISPWLLGFSDVTVMRWSNVIAGGAIMLMAIWNIFDVDEIEETSNNQE